MRNNSLVTKSSLFYSALLLGLVAVFGYAQAPVPFINQPLVPDAVAPGGPAFTLTINGTGFVSNSVVNWNGSPLATKFINHSRLTASVPAANIATASTAWVTVVNPAPGGGTSNLVFFTVTAKVGNSVGFGLASSSAVGYAPEGAVVGDFNGDGKLDLAVANAGSNTVSILLGDGSGNFTLASSPGTGVYPSSVAVGDFNGDGKLDLAVVNSGSNTVSILLGDGTGNFALASSPATGDPVSVAVGDFNGDGKLDLAVANYETETVSILLGDGTGNFTLASSPPAGAPSSVAVGDFNGDGKLDLAVANYDIDGTVSILLGDGTGHFTLASSPATGAGPTAVAVGDFNGDGKLDLAVTSQYQGNVSILLGDGKGNFTLTSSPGTGGSEPNSVAVGDLNGDGKLDLAVANFDSNTVSILLGDGTGNFTLAGSPPTGIAPYSVAVGDFNGDGKLDLAAVNWCGNDPTCNSPGTVFVLLEGIPGITLSSNSFDFGTQLVATTSSPQTVTLTNSGGATLHITSITASANFLQTNDCGAHVAVGGSCTITVTFRPGHIGTLTGTVTIRDNAFASPQTVSLTGVGTVVTLLPPSLDFGSQPVGTTSTAQTVTLTNYAQVALSVYRIHFSGGNLGDFAQTNTCGTSVAAGASCTISVTFTPKGSRGGKSATLNVADNGGASPQQVTLSGTGT